MKNYMQKWLERNALTQKEAARFTGLDEKTINNFATGRIKLTRFKKWALERAEQIIRE
jgi:predicted XRE-type DNA-binding protein